MSTKHAANQHVTPLQSELDHTPEELAHEGALHSSGELLDAARTRLRFAQDDEAALADWKFDAPWRSAMEHKLAAIEAQQVQRHLATSDAKPKAAQANSAGDTLHKWVKTYLVAVDVSPRAVQQVAPHPVAGWQKRTQLATAVAPLLAFAEKQPLLLVKGGHTAFAAAGRDALQAFTSTRTEHLAQLKALPKDTQLQHQLEGVVALELRRLAKVAREALPPERAKLYAVTALSHHPKSHHKPADPGPVAPPTH